MVNTAGTADACMQSEGEGLVRAILRGVAVSCPQRLMRTLAVLLHGLLNHATYGQPVRAAFQACMLHDEVLSKRSLKEAHSPSSRPLNAVWKNLKFPNRNGSAPHHQLDAIIEA